MPLLNQKVLKIKSTLKKSTALHCSAFSSLALYIYNKNNFHHWLTITILGSIQNIAAKNQSHQLVIVIFFLTQYVSFSDKSHFTAPSHPPIYSLTNFILTRNGFLPTLIIISSLSKPPITFTMEVVKHSKNRTSHQFSQAMDLNDTLKI